MGVTPGRTLHIHGLSFRGVSRSDLCVEGGESPATSRPSVSESSPGEEPDNPGPKWARPDLDWRPSGYQPDAPTRLSYGPAAAASTQGRLKRSLRMEPHFLPQPRRIS